jgi:para-aminobenzoate synthetase component 1
MSEPVMRGATGSVPTASARVREIVPAPEPFAAFQRLAALPRCVFLDSAARDPARGRFSYITASPFEVIEVRGGRTRLLRPAADALAAPPAAAPPALREESAADPLALARERIGRFPARRLEGLPPFQGGAAGLFGYGLSRYLERLPAPRWDEFELPDLVLGLYDWVVAFDHRLGTCHVVSHGFPAEGGGAREKRARERELEIVALLGAAAPPEPVPARGPRLSREDLAPSWPLAAAGTAAAGSAAASSELLTSFSRPAYLEAVERAIEHIRAGDIFQVNLSQRLLSRAEWPPLELYRRLRTANPAPFAGYLDTGFDAGGEVVASSSPEQFLSLEGSTVVTRPIKGTRARGYTPEADAFGGQALLESDKDRAENVMIVDLLRNDISRVARPYTVEVPRLFELEGHPTVHHLVSEVRGELREGLDAIDLLAATFPGGSVTGAPKVRAMEIIAELEPTARGPYCGSLGWIAFHGGMSLSILIRTMTLARGWVQFPAGGGIVHASRPEAEYQETLDKAAGMARALL